MGRPSKFPPEVRERAVRLVLEQESKHESRWSRPPFPRPITAQMSCSSSRFSCSSTSRKSSDRFRTIAAMCVLAARRSLTSSSKCSVSSASRSRLSCIRIARRSWGERRGEGMGAGEDGAERLDKVLERRPDVRA